MKLADLRPSTVYAVRSDTDRGLVYAATGDPVETVSTIGMPRQIQVELHQLPDTPTGDTACATIIGLTQCFLPSTIERPVCTIDEWPAWQVPMRIAAVDARVRREAKRFGLLDRIVNALTAAGISFDDADRLAGFIVFGSTFGDHTEQIVELIEAGAAALGEETEEP